MAGPGDEIAAGAGGRGHLRASHADREQVIGTLKAAFVQGMLAKDELDLRVGRAFAARTYADLAAVTADLPTGLAAVQSPEAARQTGNKKAVAALTGATAALVGMVPAGNAVQTAAPPWPVALSYLVTMIVLLVAVPTGWLWLFHAWIDKRASRPSDASVDHTEARNVILGCFGRSHRRAHGGSPMLRSIRRMALKFC